MIFLKSSAWLILICYFFGISAEAAGVKIYSIAEATGNEWIYIHQTVDTKSPIIGRFKRGDSFAVKPVGDKYLILDGTFAGGYVAPDFLSLIRQFSVVKAVAANTRIRSVPNKNGRIIAIVDQTAYMAAQKKGSWYEITDGPFRGGFVTAELVEPMDETMSTPTEAAEAAATSDATPASNAAIPPDAGALAVAKEVPVGKAEAGSGVKGPSSSAPAVVPPVAPPVIVKPNPTKNAPVELPKAPAWDEKAEQRFNEQVEKAFKNKKSKTDDNRVILPVYYENAASPVGNVNSRFQSVDAKEPEIERAAIFEILHKLVAEEWFKKPEIKALDVKGDATTQWIPLAALQNQGIQIEYNLQRVALVVHVPPELRATDTRLVARGNEIWGGEGAESPSKISSYLNVNSTEILDSRNSTYKDRRAPLEAQLENGTNIAGFVLEAYGDYTEDRHGNLTPGRSSFVRQDVRVNHDIPSINARASVGDVVYPVQSFQTYRPMQGAEIHSQLSMSPSKLTFPSGDYDVYLKNKSKVYIWVNDQLQQVLELPAGRHNLRDFQYTSGMNNVRFEIVDEFGQSETRTYSYFSSTEMLKTGLSQFSYAYGRPSSYSSTGERIYDAKNATFSGFHRYGFGNYFTGGANLQNDPTQSVFGLEGTWSTKIGYLKLEPVFSHSNQYGAGGALGSHYTYVDYDGPEKTQRSFNLGMSYRSNGFSDFGNLLTPSALQPFELSLGITRGLSKMLSTNFSFDYTFNKKVTVDVENSYSLRLGVSSHWASGISANLTASHTRTAVGKDDISVMGFMIWSFPKEKQTISASLNTGDGSSRLGWNYAPSSGADSASYQADYRESKMEKGYDGSVAFNGNRSRATLMHEVILPKVDDPATPANETEQAANVTTLQLGTALVFAGGRLGIGRPVTDSFAIIAPVKSLSGQQLLVNPDSQGNYIAKSDWLGPAVVPEIPSYNPNIINVEGKDLPVGVSIPKDHFNIYPSYKNGYAFRLGTDANVYLKVTLLDANAKPIEMAAAVATYLDDTEAPPVTVFTSRKGRVQSEGFRSGRYKLNIEGEKYAPIEFSIPENTKEEYDLGTLTVKEM